MQGNNLFNNGLLQPKKPPIGQEQQKMTRYHQLRLVFGLVGVLLYPFAILGSIPLLIGLAVDKRDKAANVFDMDYESFLKRNSIVFLSFSAVLFVINVFAFILWIPRGYLSAYLLFPLNLLHTALRFNWETIVALLIGSSGMGAIFLAFSSFVAKRKVISKEDERKKITESKAYKGREKNKFEESQRFTDEQEEAYEEAVETVDIDKYKELSNQLLLGTSEFGLPYIINFSEFNQHVLVPATTGSGKTTLLQLIVQHAVKFNLPVILIDGKGARDTLESMREIARFYDKEVHAFTDDGDMRYNPVEHGNDVSIRDKLVSLAETESVFYSSAAKLLLENTVQLIDLFSTRDDVNRKLEDIQKYLLPRNVLRLFADKIEEKNPTLYEIEVEVKQAKPKKKSKKNETKVPIIDEEMDEVSEATTPTNDEVTSEDLELEEGDIPPVETEIIVLNPNTLQLDDFYYLLKRNLFYLSKKEKIMFERLFTRYEHKDSPFYLYATSESLQTNINMLLDSELGHLFDTTNAKSVLDVQQIVRDRSLVYVSFNGLIYKEYIRTLAQMLVGDVNYFASEMYRKNVKREVIVIFDEPASYLNEQFIDMVNKGRGAGVHGIFTPQTMADIAKLGDKLMEQLVGNVNTVFIGKTNEKGEAEYWSETMGTYQDIDVTSVTEQEDGYSDVGKSDWSGDRGTKRNVDRFKVNPNVIKSLRTGEFIIYRTAENVNVPPQKVYVRNALEWLRTHNGI
ncbi:MAG: TraM recognition domain-containing protein [Enterococcus faecalis]|uniref:type IV secretory system conjugative DNA transfer family protein n=1 Tax=Enterococcus faecalis TaxID=1351 RepID=UPI0013D52092|nr:TraM recognition domain-containing protein [Enterococcus faecalis]MDU7772872.1 TraM recognition domain-containing protein [Enterococcus faecalis]MDV2499341.1 TraM recognition domain-containing protein [Enterococcus faecalis]NFA95471.1 DUF87 domain-containing protein [Enterococcus faecalis]NRC83330.1 TraM recognition domain-containing protein [Enterococcus faecalis]HAP5267414.1 TraM recognition domain-containing protein [Enterococcus faecalis]